MKKKILTASISFLMAMGAHAQIAYDAPLQDNPISLGSTTTPNLLFLLDDSGSMRESALSRKEVRDFYEDSSVSRYFQRTLLRSGYYRDIDFTPDSDAELLNLCHAINVFAYNPLQTYLPWAGVDSEGNAFANQSLNQARRNPFLPTAANTNNIEDHFYLTPLPSDVDDQGNGVVEYNYRPELRIPADPEGLLTEEDVGICGPLLRTYENINSYVMTDTLRVEQEKGILVDTGGAADPAQPNSGYYIDYDNPSQMDFVINSGRDTTILNFPDSIDLAFSGNSFDTLNIYVGDVTDNNGNIPDGVTPVASFSEFLTTSLLGDAQVLEFNAIDRESVDQRNGEGNLIRRFIRYTNVPNLAIPSEAVTIEFTSSQAVDNARGFVIGWNLDANDIATSNRVLTVDECVGDYCKKVNSLSTEEEKINYANWYTYYRNKNLVMKAALGQAIMGISQNESSQPFTGRTGFAILNDFNRLRTIGGIPGNPRRDGVGKIITQIESNEERFDLLNDIYQIPANGSTPLRSTLVRAGEYFSASGTPNNDAVRNLFGQVELHDTSETVATDSPILREELGGSCQKNYSVMFTDGQWTEFRRDRNFQFIDADSNGDSEWDSDASFTGGISNSLADVAMDYFERDIAPNVPDEVVNNDSRFDGRPIPHQHMITMGISFGVEGDIPFTNERNDFPFDPLADGFDWGNDKTDDLAHAAWNSRGSFYSASDANDLVNVFNDILNIASQTQVTTASASLSTSRVDAGDDGGSYSYRSFYDTVANHGDVLSYVLDNNNTPSLDDDTYVFDQSRGSWSANDRLSSAINNGVSARQIITQGANGAIAFTANNADALKEAQRTDLLTNITDISEEEYLTAAINYIRGVDNQTLGFRSRANIDGENNAVEYNLLGPILNSPALYIDGSADGYPDAIEDEPYSTYAATKAELYDGNELIFAGANDGMLHAFRANAVDPNNSSPNFGDGGGDEVFAYIPSPDLLTNELNETMVTGFTNKAYVDGAMVSADVFVEGAWATYLVGALRTGGQGIYALDISNPEDLKTAESNASEILKWEFTHPQLGNTFGQPQIAKMNGIVDGQSSWVAIFGNGYGVNDNCERDITEAASPECGTASLFIVDLETGQEINIPTSNNIGSVNMQSTSIDKCSDPLSNCNGLSSPAIVDIDNDSIVDRIYAGDLHGNMWVFDVSSSTTSDWSSNVKRLFSACENNNCGVKQPITARPVVTRHPTQLPSADNNINLMVYFGTGQYIDSNDLADENTQSFYGVWDDGDNTFDLDTGNLVEQEITVNTATGGLTYRTLTTNPVNYSASGNDKRNGWYINLPGEPGDLGERVIFNAIPIDNVIYFITVNPGSNACSGGGSSFIMGVNAATGGNAVVDVFDGFGNSSTTTGEAGIKVDGIVTGASVVEDADGNKRLVISDSNPEVPLVSAKLGDNSFKKPAGRRAWSIIH